MRPLVALIVTVIAVIICIIGLSIPYWVKADVISANAGLWSLCGNVCLDYSSVSSSMKAVRAFEILGVILGGVAVILALLKMVAMKEKSVLVKLAGVLALIAGAFMIVGAIIFAAKTKKDSFSGWDLHAGFALCIISGVVAIVGGILFLISRDTYTVQ